MNCDPRAVASGLPIPSLPGYCDQPYIVRLPDGNWLCVMTTGPVEEGLRGQRIVAMRSPDRGRTWSEMVDIEDPEGDEASWVMPFLTPYGRVYAFYTWNRDGLRRVATDPGHEGLGWRVDTLGAYAYRWSDDGGRTWSAQRGEIPLPAAAIDRMNPYGGEVRFFWGVGKPILHRGSMYLGFARVGAFGQGFMATSEGALVASDNIASERDPSRLRFRVLPDGEVGLRAPNGPRCEETCVAGLSDGSLLCSMRGLDGFVIEAVSRDGGATFSVPAYAVHRPGGRRLKHPLACAPLWRLSDGRLLRWYHNHGGRAYEGRNPAWLCGGIERDGVVVWSQPEIALYDHEQQVRISYPDLIEEEDGTLYLSETQKRCARVHRLERELVDGLFRQFDPAAHGPQDQRLRCPGPGRHAWPGGARLAASGVSIVCTLEMPCRAEAGTLLSWSGPEAEFALAATAHGSLAFAAIGAGCSFARDQLGGPGRHRVALIIDARARRILLVVDGELVDGGSERQYGYGWLGFFQPATHRPAGITLHPRAAEASLWDRALTVSEAVLLTR